MQLDRSKLAPREVEMLDKIVSFGFTEADAELIASCILTKKSCSWVNTDPVSEESLAKLKHFLHGAPIHVTVTPVSTRSKFVWDVKVRI